MVFPLLSSSPQCLLCEPFIYLHTLFIPCSLHFISLILKIFTIVIEAFETIPSNKIISGHGKMVFYLGLNSKDREITTCATWRKAGEVRGSLACLSLPLQSLQRNGKQIIQTRGWLERRETNKFWTERNCSLKGFERRRILTGSWNKCFWHWTKGEAALWPHSHALGLLGCVTLEFHKPEQSKEVIKLNGCMITGIKGGRW